MKEFFKNLNKQDIRNWIALIIVIGCFVQLTVMQFHPMPETNKDLLNMVIGFVFGGALAGVIGYYFGSTKTDQNNKTNNE